MLRIDSLAVSIQGSLILRGISLGVGAGELVCLVGRNGAGKTTTMKSIMGMVARRSGSVKLEGKEVVSSPSHRIARLGLAFCPEERGIFASLDVRENLLLPPRVREGGFSEAQVFELFPNLRERLYSQGTRLSGGEQQMLAVARILRTGARLLLLDEISEGLAPVIVQKLAEMVTQLRKQGYTIVMVEQNFQFAAPLADRFMVMEHGEVIQEFTQAELPSRVERLHEYLGV